ncbi:MAG: hypothetical protein JXA62_07995 [Candidatus Aminicenantes bacterium]|nr:hypothetical protein [Candidatus Aminicenantes bacterium]
MPDKGTKKKVVRVESPEPSGSEVSKGRAFTPTPEAKKRAGTKRLLAILSWIVAIACEAGAIYLLLKPPINTTWLIVLIAVDLVFVVIGSLLWKKANRLDPASEKDKFRFFVQNQLGVIIAIIAFLPLVILIFTNKDLSGKQKGLVGTIAVIALIIAGITGADFNPPSQEEYAAQTAEVESLTGGRNFVYWTKSGTKYHIYSDCHAINRKVTDQIFEGTVAQARELKNITELCSFCRSRAEKEKQLQPVQDPDTTEVQQE